MVAGPGPVLTVGAMAHSGSARRRRGFTMVEAAVVLVVLGVLAGAVVAASRGVTSRTNDTQGRNILRGVAAAEEIQYRRFASFVSSDAGLAALDTGATFTTAGGESTIAGAISVATGTTGGTEVVGMATLTKSGTCLTLRVSDPASTLADTTAQFTPSAGGPCTGATALAQTGRAW